MLLSRLRRLSLFASLICGACTSAFAADVNDEMIDHLISQMTIEEKVGQLTMASADSQFDWPALARGEIGSVLNYATPYAAADVLSRAKSRLGIPLLVALDVIHGYRTIFPVPLADAASFDPDVTYRSARISAEEARSVGIALTFAPMVDLARDPRWGRMVEGSGEDPTLASIFSAARVRGFRDGGLGTTVKHFAGYGAAEAGRDYNSVEMSEAQLRDLYLPSYHAAIDAGAEMVMTAFVAVGGIPATANQHLLRDILRRDWGFDGVVVSDLHAIREMLYHGTVRDEHEAMLQAFRAGVDIDMDDGIYQKYLPEAVRTGEIAMSAVDQSVRRVLQLKARLGLFRQQPIDPAAADAKLLSPGARQAARELARKTFVLLQNQSSTLPISPSVKKIAVIGGLAASRPDQHGPDAADGHNLDAITLVEGLQARYKGKAEVAYAEACEMHCHRIEGFDAAIELARQSDYIVLALGEPRDMTGEAGSRADLRLPGHQTELVELLAKLGKPIALVLFNGRALALEDVPSHVGAILIAWYPGSEGGNALADVLSGDVSPSGKLPVSFPKTTGQVPITYNHLPTGRPAMANDFFTSKYVDTQIGPLYAFGFGMSYSDFKLGLPKLANDRVGPDDVLTFSIDVTNTGDMAADEVIQLYTHQQIGMRSRPVRELKAFQRVALKPGETKQVTLKLPVQDLSYTDQDGSRILEAGTFDFWVGDSSEATDGGQFVVTDGRHVMAVK